MLKVIVGLACMLLAGCAASPEAFERTIGSPMPPEDLWVGVTVLGPPRSVGYSHLPRAQRPARYVIEADRVLRASLGPGASEKSLPPQLRPLTDEQWVRVWDVLRGSSLARTGEHAVSRPPSLEDRPGATVIVIAFRAGGQRRMSAVVVGGEATAAEEEAARMVDVLADLAWIPERQAEAGTD